ncbi:MULTISPECIES: MerR family transcriptional regulator [unclassified Streptomyces]|uniref:MerR family transcriptional regulator n=1 Tax=unclassified Streptomyces TaxID=2593676 RepID=UPI002DD898D1|nr:MerR family transcriptional regulator [Streptomyces sp. NBC_00243]WRZ17120.1 MerR family transcriptional regulator [Streptomyces sp. NBC_00243]
MRIGEIAALVGVTPRAVRHYHHLGLLPEPVRRSNGYRSYGIREAILLARIRRLTELGLGLDEVRDVLADAKARDLVDVLEELDKDLERQDAAIQERRAQLAPLRAEARAGRLAAQGPMSPEFTSLLAGLGDVPHSPIAVQDREHLAFLDAVIPEQERGALMATLHGMREHAGQVYGLLDALADDEPDDPRVDRAAEALAALLPDALVIPARQDAGALANGIFADLAPAQAAAVRRAMQLMTQRKDGSS